MLDDAITLNPHVRYRTVGDEGVVVNVEHDQVMVVNELGIRTLELIRDTGSRKAIVAALVAEYETTPAQVEADLEVFLDELRAHRVLATQSVG